MNYDHPSLSSGIDDDYHGRIMQIGYAARDYLNDNPPFEKTSDFEAFAMEVDGCGSPHTIKNLLDRKDLRVKGKQGTPGGSSLKETIDNLLSYVAKHEKTKNNLK